MSTRTVVTDELLDELAANLIPRLEAVADRNPYRLDTGEDQRRRLRRLRRQHYRELFAIRDTIDELKVDLRELRVAAEVEAARVFELEAELAQLDEGRP